MAPVSNSVARLSSHYISNEGLLQEKVDRFWKLESSGIYEQEYKRSLSDPVECEEKFVSEQDEQATMKSVSEPAEQETNDEKP